MKISWNVKNKMLFIRYGSSSRLSGKFLNRETLTTGQEIVENQVFVVKVYEAYKTTIFERV